MPKYDSPPDLSSYTSYSSSDSHAAPAVRGTKGNAVPAARGMNSNAVPAERGTKSNVAPAERGTKSNVAPAEREVKSNVAPAERGTKSNAHIYNPFYTGTPKIRPTHGRTSPTDRQEIIRRLKSTEQAALALLPPPHLDEPDSTILSDNPKFPSNHHVNEDISHHSALGLDISRPKSALHRGDFHEQHAAPSTSPVVPWHHAFSAFSSDAHRNTLPDAVHISHDTPFLPARSRALSHASQSTSFTYHPPTSPLVNQANAADIPDYADARSARRRQYSPDQHTRTRTYSPRLHSQSTAAATISDKSDLPSRTASLRRESTLPYQAHQPRRVSQPFHSLPQTPYMPGRRPSVSDTSPLHHAPMVGSYEESILRGRMSTTPSKPLDFVAQIGVLGKGDCKPSLKCPSHIIVPFPAVFYSYPSALAVDPEPSPYVGMIDLESASHKPPLHLDRRKHTASPSHHLDPHAQAHVSGDSSDHPHGRLQSHRSRRRSSKEPPGGAYRIPQQGQLQIVLKNPNKTAVKLFLVPYDLTDMEPGQKTFIRQRSYSAGPIIDMPVDSRTNYGTDRPEAALSATTDPKNRPVLRYLVHLHICCPSRNRYYLYQNIRVVFANRVPDGKEKLRSEIQMPEPRYAPYKPARESNGNGPPPADMDVARRRRSVMISTTSASDGSSQSRASHHYRASLGTNSYGTSCDNQLFVQTYVDDSFHFPSTKHLPTLESRPPSRGLHADIDMEAGMDESQSPTSSARRPTGLQILNLPSLDGFDDNEIDTSLVFSRETSRERLHGMPPESLLSRKLKNLGMHGSQDRRSAS